MRVADVLVDVLPRAGQSLVHGVWVGAGPVSDVDAAVARLAARLPGAPSGPDAVDWKGRKVLLTYVTVVP